MIIVNTSEDAHEDKLKSSLCKGDSFNTYQCIFFLFHYSPKIIGGVGLLSAWTSYHCQGGCRVIKTFLILLTPPDCVGASIAQ